MGKRTLGRMVGSGGGPSLALADSSRVTG